jgi:predicted  nucleic acid-binding Zn-ribbon protein
MNKTEIKLSHRITALEEKIPEILAEIVNLETRLNQEIATLNQAIASLNQRLYQVDGRVTGYHPQPPSGENA